MALFEQSPSARSSSRFGKLSSNMFFTRNTAKPRRVRHIEGLNGALICNVNDDPSIARSTSSSSLDFSRTNLHHIEPTRRAERLLPPMGFWNTYGVVQDTDRWRHELAALASASGLGLEKDEEKYNQKPTTVTTDQANASRSGARYSARTGRFNEGTAKSRGRTGSKHGTAYSNALFSAPENEREMWMLQVLCQLLGTSSLEDVQSWLVSATHAEKEQARTMINSALCGLKESERTTSNDTSQQPIDFDSLTSFVAKQKNEEKQASQKYMKETLTRPLPTLQSIHEEQQTKNDLSPSWTNLANTNNASTYQSAFQNHQRRAVSSFDTTHRNDDEQIETTEVDNDQQQRPRSVSLTKTTKPQTAIKRSTSNYQQKHQIDSLQLHDDDDHLDYKEEEQQQPRDTILPPIKAPNESDNAKSRKIRELQNKISRQEEEAKKQLSELQSKQSRLENALKLLTKQTSSYGKHRPLNQEEKENSEVTNTRHHLRHGQIPENQATRSFSGVWKPDASTLQRN